MVRVERALGWERPRAPQAASISSISSSVYQRASPVGSTRIGVDIERPFKVEH